MRGILIVLMLMLTNVLSAQTYIEYVSEKTDSMALISKSDIDKINKVFIERNVLDSLYTINERIILTLKHECFVKDSIIFTQKLIIANDKLLQQELELRNNQTVEFYGKKLRQEKNKTISFQTLTGAGIIAIILLILL